MNNTVHKENQRLGTSQWTLAKIATNQGSLRLRRPIEGYASATSVAPGDTLGLFVHTEEPTYSIDVYRLGWYGGLGGRLYWSSKTRAGIFQAIPQPEMDGLICCNWIVTDTLLIESDWVSGVYVAKLRSQSGWENYIIFAVRDGRSSRYLFQMSVTTYQAYNQWPLREWSSCGSPAEMTVNPSLYSTPPAIGQPPLPPARAVSFNRPYGLEDGWMSLAQHCNILSTVLGAGEFFWWEINMMRFLEREGYDVTYCTSIDVHRDSTLLYKHRAFLSVGHDEYWTNEMRANVEAARNRGVNLGFFSANTCFDRIRFRDSECRVFERFADPGGMGCDPAEGDLTSRSTSFNDEDSLLGIRLVNTEADGDMTGFDIESENAWIFSGTDLCPDSKIPGIIGYEVDAAHRFPPAGLQVLARSTFVSYKQTRSHVSDGLPRAASLPSDSSCLAVSQQLAASVRNSGKRPRNECHMTLYHERYTKALVVACGTIQWSWGLDNYAVPKGGRPSLANAALQQITRNILDRFATKGSLDVVAYPQPIGAPSDAQRWLITQNNDWDGRYLIENSDIRAKGMCLDWLGQDRQTVVLYEISEDFPRFGSQWLLTRMDDGCFTIANYDERAAGRLLDCTDDATPRIILSQVPASGPSESQRWMLLPLPDGTYVLRNSLPRLAGCVLDWVY